MLFFGPIRNRSAAVVKTALIMSRLESLTLQSKRIKSAAQKDSADFHLVGFFNQNLEVDDTNKERAVFEVNLRMTEAKTDKVAWSGLFKVERRGK